MISAGDSATWPTMLRKNSATTAFLSGFCSFYLSFYRWTSIILTYFRLELLADLGPEYVVEGEVEPTAKFGDAVHQSFWQTPDVGFLSHCLTDDCNQFIGGKSFVVSHVIDSGSFTHLLAG